MTTAIDAYTFGNCTYYVATRFPRIYPYLGNALQWVDSARKQGYTILPRPAPDTIVVYGPGHGYSSLGHVAVVESVNANGTFNVSEMNYKGFDLIDNRVSTMSGVIGFVVPPGSQYAGMLAGAATKVATTNCVVGGPHFSILGSNIDICMDGVVGVLAIGAGVALLVVAVSVFISFTLKKDLIKVLPLAEAFGGPVGAAATIAQTSQSKPKPNAPESQPSQQEQEAAHNQRMATAKARMPQSTYTAKTGKKYEVNLESGPDYGKRKEIA